MSQTTAVPRALPATPEKLADVLDETYPHDGPGWPLVSVRHCTVCRDRKLAGWRMFYPPTTTTTPSAGGVPVGRMHVTRPALHALPRL